jgi:tetrahydromethanopterin S-methyltransferase subunit B
VELIRDKNMAHFAKLGVGNIIEKVEVVSNDVATTEQVGVDFLNNLYGTRDVWKQTSFNTRGGVHKTGGTPFRKNFAGIGYIYDQARDAFIPPKPFNSWTLNETTCLWESPIPEPTLTQEQIDNNNYYEWNEQNRTWDLV